MCAVKLKTIECKIASPLARKTSTDIKLFDTLKLSTPFVIIKVETLKMFAVPPNAIELS